jgi:hypothetical protein
MKVFAPSLWKYNKKIASLTRQSTPAYHALGKMPATDARKLADGEAALTAVYCFSRKKTFPVGGTLLLTTVPR